MASKKDPGPRLEQITFQLLANRSPEVDPVRHRENAHKESRLHTGVRKLLTPRKFSCRGYDNPFQVLIVFLM
jgi:hypothetical protein